MSKFLLFLLAVVLLAVSGACFATPQSDDCCPEAETDACAFCAAAFMVHVCNDDPPPRSSVGPTLVETATTPNSLTFPPPAPPPKQRV